MSESLSLPLQADYQLFRISSEEQERIFRKIKLLHGAAAICFWAQMIGYIAGEPDVSAVPTAGFSEQLPGKPIGVPSIHSYRSFNPCHLIIAFVVLAAVDHTITALICQLRPDVTKDWLFVRKNNPLRWIEYFFSASVMVVAIAILCGIHDMHLWFSLGMLNACGILTGQMLELLPRGNIRFGTNAPAITHLTYWLGSLTLLSPWITILCYFAQANDPPTFVYAAFAGTMVMFATFAVNAYLHNVLGLYDFHTAEVVYVALSFTAKTFLAADVFGGLRAAS